MASGTDQLCDLARMGFEQREVGAGRIVFVEGSRVESRLP